VPVQEPRTPVEHLGVERPLGAHHRQARHRQGPLDGIEVVTPAAHDEQGGAGVVPADLLGGDDRVDPAAEGHEGGTTGRLELDGVRLGERSLEGEPAQVDAVAVGELAEAVEIEGAQPVSFGRGGGCCPEIDDRRGGGLVVRDARRQKDEPCRGARCRGVESGPGVSRTSSTNRREPRT